MYYGVRIVLLATLAAPAFLSFRAARADFEFRRGDPDSVAKAVALAPGNTEYLELRALQIDYEGANSAPLLERAAALNPTRSAPRIRLGLAAESRGDFSTAEKWLLDAARIDRQYEPRWTLANFYFRLGDQENFWRWIRSALEISYGDRAPAFDLAWRMSEHPERAIPGRHEVLAAYLAWLLETKRPVAEAAAKLTAAHDSTDRDLLLAACDTLIATHQSEAAWTLWRTLGFDIVTFASPRVARGFDWQPVAVTGVTHLDIDQPRPAHRINFNGSQSESTDLLRRVLKLTPGRRYSITWQSQPEIPGLEWRIADESVPLTRHQLEFTAPADLVPLTLAYHRPPGEVRPETSFELHDLEIR